MSYTPISGIPPQLHKDGDEVADGYWLKAYTATTTTPLSMATDAAAGTLLVKCKLNTQGYPLSNSADDTSVFIPYFNADYKLALYLNETDADADTTANADWVVDSIESIRSAETSVSIVEHGALCDAVIDSAGTLTGTDDTTAIQAALDYADTNNIPRVTSPGSFRITAQLNIPNGVTFDGGGGFDCPYYRIGTGYENLTGGPTIFVDFGSGLTDRANAAVKIRSRSRLTGFSFWYPGQDMNGTTATAFPPAITVHPTVHAPQIDRINLGNAYEGIDALLTHTQLRVNHIVGAPLAYGIRVGSSGDNPNIRNVHFQGFYAFRGTIIGANLPTWIAANGKALDLRRSSWGIFENIFAYGYNYGIYATYQAAGTNLTEGGVESGHFARCDFDQCYYPIWFDHGTAEGNVHWGATFTDCFWVSNDASDATRITGVAFTWDADVTGGAELNSFIVKSCKIHGADDGCMKLTNVLNFSIDAYFQEWGNAAAAHGIELINCDYGQIVANMDGQADAGRTGIKLTRDNSNITIDGVFRDFVDTPGGAVIEIADSNNSDYTILADIIETTGTDVLDSQGLARYAIFSEAESVTTTNVITARETGKTFYLNAAGGFVSTLPAPTVGLRYTFIVGTALSGGTCTVVTNASANIMNVLLLDIVGELVYATGQDVVTFTDGCLVGARLEAETDGTTWFCKAYAGADGDITTGVT